MLFSIHLRNKIWSQNLLQTFLAFSSSYYKQNFEGKQLFVVILFIKRPNKPQEEIDDILFW